MEFDDPFDQLRRSWFPFFFQAARSLSRLVLAYFDQHLNSHKTMHFGLSIQRPSTTREQIDLASPPAARSTPDAPA
jgi:hypothetical protein